jgi:hypothetical protein
VTLGHLFVSDFLTDAVDGFSINSTSGGLTPITGSPFPVGSTPPGAGGLSNVLPGNFYLYAADLNAGTVAGFTFDSASGEAYAGSRLSLSRRQHSRASGARLPWQVPVHKQSE